jgi:Flp pilus assembly protein TadG
MTLRTKVWGWLRRLIHAEDGINLVLLSAGLTVLIGMAGVAVDGSNIYFQRQRMQIAADAAALGGARQLAINATLDAVDVEINQLALANAADRVEWSLTPSERGVDVVAYRTFQAYFARVMGFDVFTVNARAQAQYEPVTGTDGLFPLTLSCDCVEDEYTAPGGGGQGGGGDDGGGDDGGDEGGGYSVLVIDEDSIDNGNPPNNFSASAVNDHIAEIGVRTQLPYFASHVGSTITLYTGQPGDEGWFALKTIPNSWVAAGPTADGVRNFLGNPSQPFRHNVGPGLGAPDANGDREALLDKIPDVTPLGAADLEAMEGQSVCAVVFDSDISINYGPLNGSLKGANLGTVAFKVLNVTPRSGALPQVEIEILDANVVCEGSATGGGNAPKSGKVILNDGTSSAYTIEYVGRTGNTWTYRVTEEPGSSNLNHWLLGSATCLNNVVSTNPTGAALGVDGSTGVPGIKWLTADDFSSGLFSFTLTGDFPPGTVQALAKSGSSYATVDMFGPICDGTNTGGGSTGGGGAKVCLPTIDFETDAAGAALTAGQVIDTEWAAWGAQVSSSSQASHPAMIFDSAAPTGGDTDLGAANASYGGPGVGDGGRNTAPGKNSAPLGKVLIVQENSTGVPDDNANGGKLIFSFNYGVNIDDVEILDVDDYAGAGTVKAYSDAAGATLIATGKMLGLGDNSMQIVKLSAAAVRRLEVDLPAGGAVASVVSCRSATPAAYKVGDLVWSDVNNNGQQDAGEAGIAGVEMELYATGLTQIVAKSVTNAGGQYVFENLPPGSYEVKVAAGNFGAGKPLEGASYATSDAGNDASDSDFNSATNKATVVVGSADVLTLDAGFRLPEAEPIVEGPTQGTVALNDNKNSKYEITYLGRNNKTYSYNVREVSGRDLSHWDLGIENCLGEIVSWSPTGGYSAGTDGSTGFVGIKWDVAESFSQGQFSFTLREVYPVGTVRALAKAGTKSAQIDIAGPDCSAQLTPTPVPTNEPTPTPTPTPVPTTTPAPTAMPDACAFHWVDWNGGASSELELKNAMNNVSVSGVWKLNQVIPAGPDVGPSLVVEAALDGRVGQTVKIPLARYDGSGYSICGFANVKLVDYNLSEEDTWVILQFLKNVIRGVETDPAADDYGARDVRFYD